MKQKILFFSLLFLIISFLSSYAQIKNKGYTGKISKQDTVFWKPAYLPQIYVGDSSVVGFELQAPISQRSRVGYYDPRAVMPKNILFLDTRGSSYYVPYQVNHKLAQIMNRPTANEVVPLFAVAMLAASVAMQYVEIEHKIRILAEDYLIDEKYFPVLKVLWQKSPQTAEQIYKLKEIENKRTFSILEQELIALTDMKLIKVVLQEKAPSLYFAAQKKQTVKNLLTKGQAAGNFSKTQRQKFAQLIRIINEI